MRLIDGSSECNFLDNRNNRNRIWLRAKLKIASRACSELASSQTLKKSTDFKCVEMRGLPCCQEQRTDNG
jgi:hypothetical protein